MKERPIRMKAWEVRAVLEGRKTQTRRAVKPQPKGIWGSGVALPGNSLGVRSDAFHVHANVAGDHQFLYCPYGAPGDRLWVRETWYCDHAFAGEDRCVGHVNCRCTREDRIKEWRGDEDRNMYYRADVPSGRFEDAGYWGEPGGRWTPSIHMPRWASRILLEVTGVRVERLQEISEQDAKAEGVTDAPVDWGLRNFGERYHRDLFRELWESNHVPGSWGANPWVWVLEHRRLV